MSTSLVGVSEASYTSATKVQRTSSSSRSGAWMRKRFTSVLLLRYCRVPLTSASKAALSPLCWATSWIRHRHNPSPNVTAVRALSSFLTAQRGQSVVIVPTCWVKAAFSVGETVYVPVGQANGGHISARLVSASVKGKASNGRVTCPWASVMKSWASSENPSRPMPQSRQVLLACPSTQRAGLRWTSSAQFLGHSSGLM